MLSSVPPAQRRSLPGPSYADRPALTTTAETLAVKTSHGRFPPNLIARRLAFPNAQSKERGKWQLLELGRARWQSSRQAVSTGGGGRGNRRPGDDPPLTLLLSLFFQRWLPFSLIGLSSNVPRLGRIHLGFVFLVFFTHRTFWSKKYPGRFSRL